METLEPAEPELPGAVRPAPDFAVIDTVIGGAKKNAERAKAAGHGRHHHHRRSKTR